MSDNRTWAARERLDLSLRLFVLKAVVQFAISWTILLLSHMALAQAGLAWVSYIAWLLIAIVTIPMWAFDLAVINDAVLQFVAGRSGFYLSQLRFVVLDEEHRAERPALSRGARVVVRAIGVLAWLVPWRPLAHASMAYLSRTPEVLREVFCAIDAQARARASRAASTSDTHEFRAVTDRAVTVGRVVEQSVIEATMRRRPRFDQLMTA